VQDSKMTCHKYQKGGHLAWCCRKPGQLHRETYSSVVQPVGEWSVGPALPTVEPCPVGASGPQGAALTSLGPAISGQGAEVSNRVSRVSKEVSTEDFNASIVWGQLFLQCDPCPAGASGPQEVGVFHVKCEEPV
jgi:hypothetical protein